MTAAVLWVTVVLCEAANWSLNCGAGKATKESLLGGQVWLVVPPK